MQTNSRNALKVGVLFFYFDYNDSKSQRAEDVVAILLKQLVYQLDELPDRLDEVYERYIKQGLRERPATDILTKLLIECSKFDKVFLVIDAFDECQEKERSKMILCFQQLSKSGISQFITTRSHLYDNLVQQLGSDPMEICAQGNDIKEYIRKRLENKAEYLERNLQMRITDVISNGVDGRCLCA